MSSIPLSPDSSLIQLLLKSFTEEFQRTKDAIAEGIQLRNLYISGDLYSPFQRVETIQEAETCFRIQQSSTKRVLIDLSNISKDFVNFAAYLNKQKGQISLDTKLLLPYQERLQRVKDSLKKINGNLTHHTGILLEEDLKALLVQMKTILKDCSPSASEEPNQQAEQIYAKKQTLELLRVEKKNAALKIEALDEELIEHTNSKTALEIEIKEVENRLDKRRASHDSNMSNGLDYMLADHDISRKKDEEALIEPLLKQIAEKEEILQGLQKINQISSADKAEKAKKNIHFICLLDNGKSMHKEAFQEMVACMMSLLEDRKGEADKFSLIVFNKKPVRRVHDKSAGALLDALKSLSVENEKSQIPPALVEAFETVRAVNKTLYTPIILMFTNPEKKPRFPFWTIKPISDTKVREICNVIKREYNNLKFYGLRMFFSGGDNQETQKIMKDFAKAGNDGKAYFKGSTETYDFFNTTKAKRTLVNVFRELGDPGRQEAQWSTQELLAELDHLKASLVQQKEFIETKYRNAHENFKGKIQMLNTRRHDDIAAEDEYYVDKIRDLEKRKSQLEERMKIIQVHIDDLRNECPTNDQINNLEIELTESVSAEPAQQGPIRQQKVILNPKGVDVEKSLRLFEDAIGSMKKKSDLFLRILESFETQTGKILEKLTIKTKPAGDKLGAVELDSKERMTSIEPSLCNAVYGVSESVNLYLQKSQAITP